MATFSYTARDKSGAIQKGTVFANDQTAAVGKLGERGLTPIVIKVQHEGSKGSSLLGGFDLKKRVKHTEKVMFSRQLATMVNAGVPITQSLSILQEQTTSPYFKQVISDCAKQVEGGVTLSAAFSSYPHIFNQVYVNMVKAGETGGLLDEVLDRLATQQEKDAEVAGKVRGAMIYPSVLMLVTLGAFTFLMVYLVPHMAVIFSSLGTSLPWYSKLMLSISNFLVHFGFVVLIGMIAAGIFGWRYIHTANGRRRVDELLVKAPIFGPVILKVNAARFARTFGSLMSSGLSVLDALHTTAGGLGNSVFRDALEQAAAEVKAGKPLSEPLRKSGVFPPLVEHMVAVGEETGQLDTILFKLATFYEKEVDAVIAGLTSVIEPILIVMLGGVVAFVVIGVYGPLAALNGSV